MAKYYYDKYNVKNNYQQSFPWVLRGNYANVSWGYDWYTINKDTGKVTFKEPYVNFPSPVGLVYQLETQSSGKQFILSYKSKNYDGSGIAKTEASEIVNTPSKGTLAQSNISAEDG